MAKEINDGNVMQALFDYATDKYGREAEALFGKYLDEFPEKWLRRKVK